MSSSARRRTCSAPSGPRSARTRSGTRARSWTGGRAGGAGLRAEGEVVPDPRLLDGPLDLAAMENGGTVADASDRFYSPPENMISPGRAAVMGDGWETRRRRDSGHDWVLLRLAATGHISQAVLDTSCFLGNAPGAAALFGCAAGAGGPEKAE